MFRRLADALLATRARAWAVIGAWLLAAVLLALTAPAAGEPAAHAGGAPADSPSAAASARLERAFPGAGAAGPDGAGGPPGTLVVHAGDAGAAAAAMAAALRAVGAAEGVTAVVSPLCADPASGLRPGPGCIPGEAAGTASADGATRTAVVLLAEAPGATGYADTVEGVRAAAREAVASAAGPAAEAHLAGPAGIANDLVAAFARADRALGAATMAIVLLILLAVYRSPVLAVIPLAAVAVALVAARGLAGFAEAAGAVSATAQSTAILTVLLFGVGTDYALIINARYREELAAAGARAAADPGPARHAAMIRAMGRAGSALASSAGTIIAALLALLVAATPVLRGFGGLFALGVAVLFAAAVSLLPALILAAGGAVFWPGGRDRALARAARPRLWAAVARGVDRAPRRVLAAALALLLALTAGLAGYRESHDTVSGLRVATDAAAGRDLIAAELGPGETAPETIELRAAAGLDEARLAGVAARLPERRPDLVARVALPRPAANADGTAGRLRVIPAADPRTPAVMDSLGELTAAVEAELAAAGVAGPRAAAAGPAAEDRDLRAAVHRDLAVLLPLLLVVVGAVLAALLRSALAPLYLMALQALGYAATMGATVLAAVTLGGDAGIGAEVPAYVLIFTIALGVDYTIFLMARYRQELAHAGPRAAMREALTRTGGVVSSAGVILAATFAVLTVMPVRELFQFGLAMAIGILLDTFVVRPLVVPAVVRLLGARALWPAAPAASATEAAAP